MVFLGDLVQTMVINTESEAAIFFLYEEDRCSIGFLAWARYTLIDLISICKRSQLREANIRLYQGLPPAESVILEDHFVTLHDKI